MTQINQPNLAQFRRDIAEALRAVEDKHGIKFNVHGARITYIPGSEFRFKLVATPASNMAEANKLPDHFSTPIAGPVDGDIPTDFALAAIKLGIAPDSFNKKFRTGNGRGLYTFTGIKLNRPQYPIQAQGPKGGRIKMTVRDLPTHFLQATPTL